MHAEVLRPVVVLAAWSMIMWLWMYATRIPALLSNTAYNAKQSIGTTGGDIRPLVPASVQWKADNYNHLMEQPTLFYAVAIALALLDAGGGINAILAWVYVGLRIAHSLVQVTINRVIVRFALHFIGSVPLLLLVIHAVAIAFAH